MRVGPFSEAKDWASARQRVWFSWTRDLVLDYFGLSVLSCLLALLRAYWMFG
jgi:hypothetical protein